VPTHFKRKNRKNISRSNFQRFLSKLVFSAYINRGQNSYKNFFCAWWLYIKNFLKFFELDINVFNSCLIVFLGPSKMNIWILESDPPIQSHTGRKKIKTHKKWDLCLMCVVQDPKIFETIVLIYMYTLLIFLSYISKTLFCTYFWNFKS